MGVVAGLVAVPAAIYGFGWYIHVQGTQMNHEDGYRWWVLAFLGSFSTAMLAVALLIGGEWLWSIMTAVVCAVATYLQIRAFNLKHPPYSADE